MTVLKQTGRSQELNESEKPHWVDPEYGLGYWRQFLFCLDGTVVSGCGRTAEEATREARKNANEKNKFLVLPDIEKLKVLVRGNLLCSKREETIRIMANILIRNANRLQLI